jgi:hypothetical protein
MMRTPRGQARNWRAIVPATTAAGDGHIIWLFAGSLRAGKRATAVMSLVHSARLNGLEPYLYLKDILARLPTQPANRSRDLLPHCWRSPQEFT